MTNFKINIYSDTCYIGKRRLDRAISLLPKTYPKGRDDTFTFTWLPHILHPSAPATGVPLLGIMRSRLGDDLASKWQRRLLAIGKGEGIHFGFGGKIGDTRDSHRLIEFAKVKGKQTEMVEGLVEALLREVGVRVGLDGEEVDDWFESGGGEEQVEQAIRESEGNGKKMGVPRYVIQGAYTVDGADDPGAFLEAFADIKATEQGHDVLELS
ncbi:hypothetical protein ACLMJK_001140 [Lecanora helva]